MTRRVVLHVGLPKTGTTYLQALLAHHRDALRGAGVLYPFVKPQAMFLGAVEVRGSHEKFGLSRERRLRHLASARRPGPRVRRDVGDQPRDPRRRRARGDREGAGAVVRARRGRGGHRPRPGQAGHRPLAGGGEAGRHPVVRRLRARAVPGRRPEGRRQASGRTSGTRRTTPRRCAGGRPRCLPSGCTSSSARRPGPPPTCCGAGSPTRVASPAPPTASSTRRPSAPPTSP